MKTIRVALLLAVVALSAPMQSPARAARPAVTVTKITYAGWHGALKISNGIVEAVIVPQIGRIMAFQWVGRPDSNPLVLNKDWAGKTVAGVPKSTLVQFGGDKLWPSQQFDWATHAPPGWPPDRAFDGDPDTAAIVTDGVRLTSPMSAAFAAYYVRVITMKPGQPRLYIHQVMEKDPKAAGDKDDFLIGIWSISQTRKDGKIILPIWQAGHRNNGFYVLFSLMDWALYPGGSPGEVSLWKPVDGAMVGRWDPKIWGKVGSKAGAGWLASLYGGNILFSEHYTYQPDAPYADYDFPAEVYTEPHLGYTEMEVLGPVTPLKAGESMTYDIYWQLNHLRRAPNGDSDAVALVKTAMK